MDKNQCSGLVSFTAQPLNENNMEEFTRMAELLKKVGVSMEANRKSNTALGLEYDYISLKLDKEKYNEVLTRHAGRKADFEGKYDVYGRCTVEELKAKLNSCTKTKIAQELGCSRMTLYRIIKNIELRNPDGNTSIWHYTS